MLHLVTLLLFLHYTQSVVGILSFTKSVYDVTIDEDKIPNRISVIGLQVDKMEYTGRIQFSLDNDGIEQKAIRIDPKKGVLELIAPLPPKSMALTVKATIEAGSNHFEAKAVVRIHVACFVGSYAWDAFRALMNSKLLDSESNCHFEFRTLKIHSDGSFGTGAGAAHAIHLIYRIHLLHSGCVVRVNLMCTVSERV
ncbi:hypothetical protein FGIG_11430 [Fasciola gigantica]|uniref:Uncharacterized protein n=1 Tax=Fasciola gigantica TaxID=46835 RepID=A0A504YY16_FASGI|nr:hypothetical protein FGIG_11430 [Fasciola gigantica]